MPARPSLHHSLQVALIAFLVIAAIVLIAGGSLSYRLRAGTFIAMLAIAVLLAVALLMVGDRGYSPEERAAGAIWGDSSHPVPRVRVMDDDAISEPTQAPPAQLPTSPRKRLSGPKR